MFLSLVYNIIVLCYSFFQKREPKLILRIIEPEYHQTNTNEFLYYFFILEILNNILIICEALGQCGIRASTEKGVHIWYEYNKEIAF